MNNLEKALRNLVNKLEFIEKDEYVRNLHKYVFSLWKAELTQAKKALEDSKKPPQNLCTGFTTNKERLGDISDLKKIDLFEIDTEYWNSIKNSQIKESQKVIEVVEKQLDLPFKHEDEA